MTVNTMSPKKKAGGCGCGGSVSGTTSSSSCSCGSTPCATCLDQGYTRPRFFAGQLLTEDDLQLLSDYVVGKNRLRNRYLMGTGVACGLQVTCQPCERGHVVVNPGYAIDCCGNDIVVNCPQELDINNMVHDLQIKLRGGYDCGDPCAKNGSYSTGTSATQPSMVTAGRSGNGSTSTSDTTAKPRCHKYCLYI